MSFDICKLCDSTLNPVNEKHDLAQCSSCSLIFSTKQYSDEEIAAVYHELYNVQDAYEGYRKESEMLLSNQIPPLGRPRKWVIKRLLNSGCRSFLEVGAGVGLIGKYLIHHGYDYVGIELDEQTAQKAALAGVRLINGTFEIMETVDRKFDALIAFEVIEHLQDLKTFFTLGRDRLKPGGLFGFTVPNFNKIKNYVDRNRIYQPPPPIHVNFFTTDNLQRILDIEHFEIVEIQVRRYPYLNLRKLNTYKFMIKGLLGLYYGPTIMCIARKKT